MSLGIISKVIEDIADAQTDALSHEYTMVNVRPGEKVSAMLDLVAALSGKSASALVAQVLSVRLAEYAASCVTYKDAILDAAQAALTLSGMFQPGCALSLLEQADVINVENGFQKTLREKL